MCCLRRCCLRCLVEKTVEHAHGEAFASLTGVHGYLPDEKRARGVWPDVSGDKSDDVTRDFGDDRCGVEIPAPQQVGITRIDVENLGRFRDLPEPDSV